jgi:short-subunit dehydrogenase
MSKNNTTTLFNKLLFPAGRFSTRRLAEFTKAKTILITGASFGIGEALTHILAEETEATLILVARTEEKLKAIQEKLSSRRNAPIYIFSSDLTQKESRAQLIYKLEKHQVDIFVSNAGKSIRRSIFKSLDRLHDFERTMALNYMAPVDLSLGLIPALIEQKGQIINISALNVHFPPAAGWAAYQASKVAFDQWLKATAIELRPKGLACSNIYLPLVRTRMIAPTKTYEHWPAMQPQAAAGLICRAILGRKTSYGPWWMGIAAFFSRLFSPIWSGITKKMIKT